MMFEISEIEIFADTGLFVLIWLVQLIIYPSFHYMEKEGFTTWHNRYTSLVSMVVGPLILIQLGAETAYVVNGDLSWLRILMILTVLTVTFFISVPCHRGLSRNGKDRRIISRLIVTNWLRTVLWSSLFAGTAFDLFR